MHISSPAPTQSPSHPTGIPAAAMDEAELGAVAQRIVHAAVEVASLYGVVHLSMADVARRAGLSRQTLYRHFPSKEALLAQAVVAEAAQVLQRAVLAAAACSHPRHALSHGLAIALRGAREHPLLDRLLRTEPESLLPLITHSQGPVMTHVRDVALALLREHWDADDPGRLALAADLATRVLVSYAVSPSEEDPDQLAEFLAATLIATLSPHPKRAHDASEETP